MERSYRQVMERAACVELVAMLMTFQVPALAQPSTTATPATAPVQAAAAEGAPSEAARRQALSPFRFILRHAEAPVKPRAPAGNAETRRKSAASLEQKETPSSEGKLSSESIARPNPELAPAPPPIQTAVARPSAPAIVAPARGPLIPIKQDGPVLPAALQQDPPLGTVKVAFEVKADGSTTDVKILQSTNRRLNGPALAAVQGWRFQPIEEARPVEIDFVFSNQ
jgi:TonB family protein